MTLRMAVLLSLLAAVPAAAQDQDPASIEHTKIVSVTAEPSSAKAGEKFELVFKIAIDPTWHIYSALGTSTPTSWKFEGPLELAGKVKEPKPKHHREVIGKDDKGKDILVEYDYHEGNVEFRVPVRLTKNAPAGPLRIPGKMTGMECDPNGCIIFEYPFVAAVTVKEGGETTPPPADGHTRIVSAAAEPSTAKVGETFRLVFKVEMDPGWHIYTVIEKANGAYIATSWEFDPGIPLERAGAIDESKPKHKKEKIGDEFLEYDLHEGQVTFSVPVRLKPGTKPGPLKLAGRMTGQECSNVCVDMAVPFSIGMTVAEGVVDVAPQEDGDASSAASKEFEARGIGWLMGIAVLGGLISLVMPCVYPLIPITITFFAKQAGTSRSQGLLLSLAYGAGIVISFTGIGFLLTILLGAQGAQIFASNPWVNLVIAAVFGAFALSLLGLFEFKLPAFVTNMTGSSGPRTGVGGAFTLGLLFSVITFTCTIPFAGTILAVAASGSHKAAGLLAMFVYSLVMAIPFLFLGLFPSMVKELPKSGGWLHTMKISAGLFEIALAAAYIWKSDLIWGWGFFDRPVVLAIWIAVSFIMALYLLGLFRVRGDSENPGIGIGRMLSGLALGAIGFYLVGGLLGRPVGVFGIVLPPEVQTASTGSAAKQRVYDHLAEAEEAARNESKPLFIEFTGYT